MAGLSFLAALAPDDALAPCARGPMRSVSCWPRSVGVCGWRMTLGLPRLFGLESEYEEQQMVAELHFVNGLIKDIASGDLEGLDMWRAFHADGSIPLEGVIFTLNPDPT